MKLYHYVHCPFCLRIRMALGFLKLSCTSIPLDYDDEETPVRLAKQKMLPIVEWDSGEHTNESLDIIDRLDSDNVLRKELATPELHTLLNRLAVPMSNLAMPHLIWSKEFSEKSRNYFQRKKESKRGPFVRLIHNQQQYLDELNPILEELESDIEGFYGSDRVTLPDILLASHLWSLYMVPEFQFSPKLHDYLQRVKKECRFNYQEDLWPL